MNTPHSTEEDSKRSRQLIRMSFWRKKNQRACHQLTNLWARNQNQETLTTATRRYVRWTEEEERFLRNHPELKDKEISIKLNRTLFAVKTRRQNLGISHQHHCHKPVITNKDKQEFRFQKTRWSEGEVEYLRNNCGVLSYKEIAAVLGRTRPAVKEKAKRLGLKRKVNR